MRTKVTITHDDQNAMRPLGAAVFSGTPGAGEAYTKVSDHTIWQGESLSFDIGPNSYIMLRPLPNQTKPDAA